MVSSSPSSPATDPGSFRERLFARLVEHVHTLIPVEAVTFFTVDDRRGTIDRSAAWFADDALRDVFGSPGNQPLDPRGRGLVEAALERERPLLLPRIDAWQAAADLLAAMVESLGTERAHDVWRSYGRASVIACPLRTEIGRPLGVLVVASLDPERPLRRTDLRAVEVVADLSAMALERLSLLEAESRRARDELQLKRASEAVSESLELSDVYRRVVEHAVEVTGASGAVLSRPNARTGDLRAVASVGLPGPIARGRVALDQGGFSEAARGRGTARGSLESEGLGSLIHAAIELGPRLYGVLSVAHESPDRFGERDLDLLVRLTRSSATAIANAIDFQRERRIARALTLGFVPASLPRVGDYDTGLLYAPVLGEPTGGDLYGLWELPRGEVAVLIGDVAGKGVENAGLSAMVRFFIEARSWDAGSPALVLDEANAMLMSRLPEDTFVTAFLGVISAETLRWANAGHLPPLHLRGGEVRELDSPGLPLGIDQRPAYREHELTLAPSDLVFAYTDGLVEARRAGETYGAERLAQLVTKLAATTPPEDLPSAVHEEITAWAGGLTDDVVALALRRRR
jgi:GAF domain-containing protein